MSRIRVTIDQIVLKGFEGGAARSLVRELEAELPTLLADRELQARWARSHRTPVLRLARAPLEPGTSGGRKLGGVIARGIAKGLQP